MFLQREEKKINVRITSTWNGRNNDGEIEKKNMEWPNQDDGSGHHGEGSGHHGEGSGHHGKGSVHHGEGYGNHQSSTSK